LQASACEPWRELIEAGAAKGRTAKSIWHRDRDIPLSWAEQRRLFGFRNAGDANR